MHCSSAVPQACQLDVKEADAVTVSACARVPAHSFPPQLAGHHSSNIDVCPPSCCPLLPYQSQPGMVPLCSSTTRANSRMEAQRQQRPGAGRLQGPAQQPGSPRAGAGRALLQQQQQQVALLGSCLLRSGTSRVAVVGGAASADRDAVRRARQAQVAAAAVAGNGRAGGQWVGRRWVKAVLPMLEAVCMSSDFRMGFDLEL
jgi:hypothetical protein